MLTCSYHVLAAFYFFFNFFYEYQNTLDFTQNLQKNQSAKDVKNPKDKSICFKIKEYLLYYSEKRKNKKSSSLKANQNFAFQGI